MAKQIFVNLPVKDLARTKDFFQQLGFHFNPQFEDDKAACLVLGENIFAMVMVEERFKDFTRKPVSDAKKSTEVLIALDSSSREEVDEIIEKAVSAGGKLYRDTDDHGWMYCRCFEDLDGHQWEFAFMDLSQLPQQ